MTPPRRSVRHLPSATPGRPLRESATGSSNLPSCSRESLANRDVDDLQWQNGHNRFNELRRRGVAAGAAVPAASRYHNGPPSRRRACPSGGWGSIDLRLVEAGLDDGHPRFREGRLLVLSGTSNLGTPPSTVKARV